MQGRIVRTCTLVCILKIKESKIMALCIGGVCRDRLPVSFLKLDFFMENNKQNNILQHLKLFVIIGSRLHFDLPNILNFVENLSFCANDISLFSKPGSHVRARARHGLSYSNLFMSCTHSDGISHASYNFHIHGGQLMN